MSVELIFEENDTGVLIMCTGHVSGGELIKANDILIPKQNVVYQIWDFSLAKEVQIEIEQIHRAAIQDDSFPESSSLTHIAFVGDTNKWGHIYETYEHMSKTWVGRHIKFSSAMFESMDEAREWINQDA